MSDTVLVVAAHPQDEILGVGGTIAKHTRNGDKVSVVLMSEGAGEELTEQRVSVLRKEAEAAASILGVEKVFRLSFPYMCFNAIPMIELTRDLYEVVNQVAPDIVYTHHRGDIHTDHQMVWSATMVVTRSFGKKIVKKILSYEDPSCTRWAPPFLEYAFIPNCFEDITDTIDIKMKALEAYESEHRAYPHPRSAEALRLVAEVWGIKISAGPTEAFELVRSL
ncbi:MAG TPA: PIG-L family deacetylase [bacterium]|nr:PIG-L family deacetylase [bacterium]